MSTRFNIVQVLKMCNADALSHLPLMDQPCDCDIPILGDVIDTRRGGLETGHVSTYYKATAA